MTTWIRRMLTDPTDSTLIQLFRYTLVGGLRAWHDAGYPMKRWDD